jgi:hypothetical protein
VRACIGTVRLTDVIGPVDLRQRSVFLFADGRRVLPPTVLRASAMPTNLGMAAIYFTSILKVELNLLDYVN